MIIAYNCELTHHRQLKKLPSPKEKAQRQGKQIPKQDAIGSYLIR